MKTLEEYQKKEELKKQKARSYYLSKKHKMDQNTYEELLKKQSGMCAICDSFAEEKSLVIDHSLKSGKIRGLLCSRCNIALGYFKDSEYNIQNALNYLKEYSEELDKEEKVDSNIN